MGSTELTEIGTQLGKGIFQRFRMIPPGLPLSGRMRTVRIFSNFYRACSIQNVAHISTRIDSEMSVYCTLSMFNHEILSRNWGFHWNEGGSSNDPCAETYMGMCVNLQACLCTVETEALWK